MEIDNKAQRRSGWGVWLRVGLSLLLLSILISQLDVPRITRQLSEANVYLLAATFIMFISERFFAGYRWYMLLVHGSQQSVSFSAVMHVVFTSSFLGLMIPGTVGFDAIRIYGVAKSTNDVAATLSSFVVERFFALSALCVIFLLGIHLSPLPLPSELLWVGWLGFMGLCSGFILVYLGTPRRTVERLLKIIRLDRFYLKIELFVSALNNYQKRALLLTSAAILGVMFQMLRVLQVQMTAAALGIDLPFTFYLAIVPLVMIAILIPATLFGLGARDFSLVYFLGLVGVTPEHAFAVSICLTSMTVAATLPGAWLYLRTGVHANFRLSPIDRHNKT